MSTSRREFLGTAALAGLAPIAGRLPVTARQDRRVFLHGVASGDPLREAVILWTRATPPERDPLTPIAVSCEIARDEGFRQIVGRAMQMATPSHDFTVKIDALGLDPGTTYWYRFSALGELSPVGRTRTLPASTSRVRLAVASCANLPAGFFNVYGRIAARADLDAVLHLGDYIYEYRNGIYGDGTAFGRIPMPDKEAVTLEDYRTRHAQYKTDPDLQAAHAAHPWITVWDDHEFANNAWREGAQNHNPELGEGTWADRRAAIIQSYLEWMPIREDHTMRQTRIYRSFAFGSLADLVMLDARYVGRDQEADAADRIAVIEDPSRTVLGSTQEAWLAGELSASQRAGVTWQIIGQQIMFAHLAQPDTPTTNTDVWDGYRAARDRLLDTVASTNANSVILTGDIHSSWAFDVPRNPWRGYDRRTGDGCIAVEFATPAVSSPSSMGPPDEARVAMRRWMETLPHLHWVEGLHRGYMVLDITSARVRNDWFFVPTVAERSDAEIFAKGYVRDVNGGGLQEV